MEQKGQHMGPNEAGEFVASRAGDLGRIVGSSDGQRVKAIMEQDADKLKQAVQSGDMATLKQTFDHLMQTQEGSRLIGEIQKMMKKG
ncbi:MAG: hypothetical protein FWE12_01130 [Oscillospiraceae bacterium]|nr:hypothetical protein [Oscillospiraceae bacterium]